MTVETNIGLCKCVLSYSVYLIVINFHLLQLQIHCCKDNHTGVTLGSVIKSDIILPFI